MSLEMYHRGLLGKKVSKESGLLSLEEVTGEF